MNRRAVLLACVAASLALPAALAQPPCPPSTVQVQNIASEVVRGDIQRTFRVRLANTDRDYGVKDITLRFTSVRQLKDGQPYDGPSCVLAVPFRIYPGTNKEATLKPWFTPATLHGEREVNVRVETASAAFYYPNN